jgi:hypothetical protein
VNLAKGFLDEVTKMPLTLFKVASKQILRQLLGVGHMLCSAPRYDGGRYRGEARRLIAFLGDLEMNFERDTPCTAEAGGILLAFTTETDCDYIYQPRHTDRLN